MKVNFNSHAAIFVQTQQKAEGFLQSNTCGIERPAFTNLVHSSVRGGGVVGTRYNDYRVAFYELSLF